MSCTSVFTFTDVTVPAVMMMRSSVVLCLAVSFAMFGYGVSLQCYSCPDGSSTKCEVKQECNRGEDACLKLTSGENVHTSCLRYADCDFMTLASRYVVPSFTFTCCQSDLCNSQEKSWWQKIFG